MSEPINTTSIDLYQFEGAPVRVIRQNGAPWFVLADVCRALEIALPHRAADRLDSDEKRKVQIACRNATGAQINDLGAGAGNNEAWFVSESGLYSLIMTSRKESAKRFKRWVTGEVLPAIRETGGYMVAAPHETPEQLAMRAITVLQATVERQKLQIATLAPKADQLELIAEAEGSHCITDAAKILQIKPKDLFSFLSTQGWVYRRAGASHWCAYQARLVAGDLLHKITTVLRADGTETTKEQVRITPRGIVKLTALIGSAARLVPDRAA